jgi:4-amino-4-deoxychorismate lyase
VHPVIYLNKSMLEATKARIAPVSSAMLYGRGVFTSVAIYNGQPFLWPKHWARLTHHADTLGISCEDVNQVSVGTALKKLIAINRVSEGRARVILLARSSRHVWQAKPPGPRKTDLLIMTGEPQKIAAPGVSIAVSPYRFNSMSPLAGIKSLNYLDHVLSWEEAHRRDFDEAVMLNERGEIVSATMANLFWLKNGTVHTPTLSTGALAGVTRDCIIKLARDHFIPLVEGIYTMPDLTDADEIFVTSAGLGMGIVTTFDFRTYSVGKGSVAAVLREAFLALTSQAK